MAVTCDHDIVGENVVIADLDIMGEVCDGHEKIAVADDGVVFRLGAAVDGDVFTEGISISNDDA